jgi:hypothetical protein
MPTEYTAISPIAQFDGTSCWAAALEWWARAAGRVAINQLNLISKYQQYWDSSGDSDSNPNYGTVSKSNLIQILSDPCWRMRCEEVRGATFSRQYVSGKLPCYVAYFESEMGGSHAVVVCAADETTAKSMDPAYGAFRNFRYGHFQRTPKLIVGWAL